jgi:hypothetical protein
MKIVRPKTSGVLIGRGPDVVVGENRLVATRNAEREQQNSDGRNLAQDGVFLEADALTGQYFAHATNKFAILQPASNIKHNSQLDTFAGGGVMAIIAKTSCSNGLVKKSHFLNHFRS